MATNYLDRRRRELGMPLRALAIRSGVSQSTVKRILSGSIDNATFGNVEAVAKALGVRLRFVPVVDAFSYQEEQAKRKAEHIVRMVQGTSALEAQAIPEDMYQQMLRRTTSELVAGSTGQLWEEM